MWISMRIPRDFVRPVLESSFAGEWLRTAEVWHLKNSLYIYICG
jgi:hypothetical protein